MQSAAEHGAGAGELAVWGKEEPFGGRGVTIRKDSMGEVRLAK